jgi:hypothetical protein
MPLDFQPVQIVLEGLDQKTDSKMRAPGKLASAINVEFDKVGALNKRRGYRRVTTSTTTHGQTPEAVFTAVATYNGELVVIGEEYLYAVGAIAADIDGGSLIRRGPVLRGSYRVRDIAQASIGSGEE